MVVVVWGGIIMGDDMVINLYNQVLAIIAASIIMVHMK